MHEDIKNVHHTFLDCEDVAFAPYDHEEILVKYSND